MTTFWIIALLIFVPSVWIFSIALFRSSGRADRELDRIRSENYGKWISSRESARGTRMTRDLPEEAFAAR